MSKKEVYLEDSLIEEIKLKRKEKGYTQEEIAELLDINVKKYSRIETKSQCLMEQNIFNHLIAILGIKYEEPIHSNTVRFSVTLPEQIKKDLDLMKEEKGFYSLNETVRFCIEEVLYERTLNKVSIKLAEDIRDFINNTYHAELEKLHKNNAINEMVLKRIFSELEPDYGDIKKRLENEIEKILRAQKY